MIMVVTVFVVVVAMLVIMPMIMFVRMLLAVFVRMIMLMAVIVIMIVLMTVIVFVVMTVFVIMLAMRMRLGGLIGAAVRLEGRLDMGDLGAQSAHHVLQHMVAADAQPVGQHFHMHVPVAEVVGGARQLPRVGAAHFGEFFRRRDNLDQPPVFQDQRIAVAKRHGIRQVEQEFSPAHAGHGNPATMPSIVIENDGIDRRRLPGALGGDEIRADHDVFPDSVSV